MITREDIRLRLKLIIKLGKERADLRPRAAERLGRRVKVDVVG